MSWPMRLLPLLGVWSLIVAPVRGRVPGDVRAASAGDVLHVPLAHRQRQPPLQSPSTTYTDIIDITSGTHARTHARALQQQQKRPVAVVDAHEVTVPIHAYFVDLGVGVRDGLRQSFGVELDSGSSATAVPSADCDNCPAEMEGYVPGPVACTDEPCPPLAPGPLSCSSPDCPNDVFLSHSDCIGPPHLESVDPQDDSFGTPQGRHGWYPRIRVTLSCDQKTGGIYELDEDLDLDKQSTFESVHYTRRTRRSGGGGCGPSDPACAVIAHLVVDALPTGGWAWWILPPAQFEDAAADGFVTPLNFRIASWKTSESPSMPRAAAGLGEFANGDGCVMNGQLQLGKMTATVHAVNPSVPATCCSAPSATSSSQCYDARVFADGSGVSGSIFRDSVQIGNVSTSGLFTAYNHDSRTSAWFAGSAFRQAGVMTGIMGLGYQYDATAPPLIAELIAASGTGVDAFGLCLEDEFDAEGEASSSLDLGGAIPSKYTGTLQYVPMVRRTQATYADGKYWTPAPVGMGLDDAISFEIGDADSTFSGFYIDSGAPGVILPEAGATQLFEEIVRWVHAHRGDSRCRIYSTVSEQTLTNFFCEDVLFGSAGDNGKYTCVHLSSEPNPDFDINRYFPSVQIHLPGSTAETVTLTLEPSEYMYITAENVLGVQTTASGGLRQGPEVPLLCSLISRWPTEQQQTTMMYGMLGAAVLQRYYTLFDRTNLRFGFARHMHSSCGRVESSVATKCAARAMNGCSSCAGYIDDAQPSAGYCLWCPSSQTCSEYTLSSVQFPCPDAQGFVATGLDVAPGGQCTDLLSSRDSGCQSLYHTMLNFLRTTAGDCGETESVVGSFLAECGSVGIRVHSVSPEGYAQTALHNGRQVVSDFSQTRAYSHCAFEELSDQADPLVLILAGLDTACVERGGPEIDGRYILSTPAEGVRSFRRSVTEPGTSLLTLRASEDSFVLDTNEFKDCVGVDALRLVGAEIYPASNGCYRRSETVLANGFPTWQHSSGLYQIYWCELEGDRGVWIIYTSQSTGYTGQQGFFATFTDAGSPAYAPPSTTGWQKFDSSLNAWVDAGILRVARAESSDCELWVAGASLHTSANGCYSYNHAHVINGYGVWDADDTDWLIYYHPSSATWRMSLDDDYLYQSMETIAFAAGPPWSGWSDQNGLDDEVLKIASLSTVVAVAAATNDPPAGYPSSGQWSVLCGTTWVTTYASVLSVPTKVTQDEPCSNDHEFTIYAQRVDAACCDDVSTPCVAGYPTACSDTCADVLIPMQRACIDFLQVIGMQEVINKVAGMCVSGH